MAEPEGTAEIESAASDIAVAHGVSDVGDAEPTAVEAEAEAGEETKAAEPPRRRLVAELLEGQLDLEGPPASVLQIVATPVHLEPDDAGQPVYQLDLSSDEPDGVILTPDAYLSAANMASVVSSSPYVDNCDPEPADSGALRAVKQLIVQRERRVMAAERDGIGAYELAIELDGFVRSLLDALRRVGD